MQRHEFPYLHPIATRWDDNDVYGHVNNVRYFAFFDTAINDWLIREGGLDVEHGAVIGLCAESHCAYTAAIAFPDAVEVGLRTERIGSSSGMSVGRRLARSTNTCTNQPSAASSPAPRSRSPIS